jgi:hypothetical protein
MKSIQTRVSRPVAGTLMAAAMIITGGCRDTLPTSPKGMNAVTPSLAVQSASTTEFNGFVDFCASEPQTNFKITPGGTLHFLGANENRWVTGNPLIDGVEQNTVLANINLKQGTGNVHLDLSLKPDAVDGTWEIRQTVNIRDGAPAGSSGVGHGTGDLQGMTIKFTTEPGVAGDNICNADMPVAPLQGEILSPA